MIYLKLVANGAWIRSTRLGPYAGWIEVEQFAFKRGRQRLGSGMSVPAGPAGGIVFDIPSSNSHAQVFQAFAHHVPTDAAFDFLDGNGRTRIRMLFTRGLVTSVRALEGTSIRVTINYETVRNQYFGGGLKPINATWRV